MKMRIQKIVLALVLTTSTTLGFSMPFDPQVIKTKEGTSASGRVSYSKDTYPEQERITTNGTIQYQSNKYLTLLNSDYDISTRSGFRDSNRGLNHLHFRVGSYFGLESFYQLGFSSLREIYKSESYGVGPYVKFSQPYSTLTLGTAYTQEREVYYFDDTETTGRMYSYISGSIKLPGILRFSSTVFAEPKVTDMTDNRLYYGLGLSSATTQYVTFGIVYQSFYDSRPPVSVPQRGYEIKTVFDVGL